MRFRAVVIAAVILAVAAAGGLAVFQIAEDARGEAGQVAIDSSDSLAVVSGIEQTLVSDANHTPTRYGDSVTVTYNGSEMVEGDDYTYSATNGTITFLVDRSDPNEADIDYSYLIPSNQATDEQLRILSEGTSNVLLLVGAATLVVLLLFVGGFAVKRITTRPSRGR